MASCSLLNTQHIIINTSSVLYMAAYFVLDLLFFFFTKLQVPGEVSFLLLCLSARKGREPTEMTRRTFILTGKQGRKQGEGATV